MNAGLAWSPPDRDECRAILEAWRRLSSAETEAIEAGDWNHLAQVQVAKATLQDRLDRAEFEPARHDSGFASVISELVERERANLRLLENRREAAREEQAAAECSRRNLRRQQALFVNRTSTSWQCYS